MILKKKRCTKGVQSVVRNIVYRTDKFVDLTAHHHSTFVKRMLSRS